MIFGSRRRVEEDLKRIRRANLPPDKLQLEEEKEAREAEVIAETRFEKRDLPALFIAAFSVILPYLLVIVGVYAIIVVGYILIFS